LSNKQPLGFDPNPAARSILDKKFQERQVALNDCLVKSHFGKKQAEEIKTVSEKLNFKLNPTAI